MRPHKLQRKEKAHGAKQLLRAMEEQLREAIAQEYLHFFSGGAMGPDIWFAEIVHALKKEHPLIKLHFILPCETQANDWPERWRERYFAILAKADDVQYIQSHYTPDCMFRRNRALIHAVSKVIAVHDGVSKGGTAYTCQYAEKQGIPIIYINPEH